MINTAPVLPLSRDASSRFLPWLIAFMVWLATLALAAVMVLSSAGDQWRKGLTGSATIQIVPAGETSEQTMQQRVDRALSILRKSPHVLEAEQIPAEKVGALLEPWLGSASKSNFLNLPIPRLIDVKLVPAPNGAFPDTTKLAKQLSSEIPGATLDDHGRWLERLLALASAVEAIGFVVLALICMAAIATIVFATRTGLAIHHDVIELLHLIGAQDDYVARQFQFNALWLGLKGGAVGVVIAIATLIILGSVAGRIEAGLLPPFSMSLGQWSALSGVAIATVIICMVTARITVIRTIRRMP